MDRRVDGGTQRRIHPNIQIVAACGLRNFHDWDIASLDLRKLFPELSDPVGGEHLVQPRDRDLGNLGELLDLLEHLASLHHIRGYKPLAERIAQRSEEHTSELQSLMRISYAVICLKKQQH